MFDNLCSVTAYTTCILMSVGRLGPGRAGSSSVYMSPAPITIELPPENAAAENKTRRTATVPAFCGVRFQKCSPIPPLKAKQNA